MAGTRFEFGAKVFNPASKTDWDAVKAAAKAGTIDEVPANIYIQHYGTLCRIAKDHARPKDMIRNAYVWWGPTCTGKSRKARELAGAGAFIKDADTKWWDGYQGETEVVIDDFTGLIGIGKLLRWFDRYSTNFEVKQSSTPNNVNNFYITSNIDPREWFPTATDDQKAALLRRLTITHVPMALYGKVPDSHDYGVTDEGEECSWDEWVARI